MDRDGLCSADQQLQCRGQDVHAARKGVRSGRRGQQAAIKEGRIPERWKDKPAKVRQKDRDARWSVKYTKAKVKEGADPKAFKPVDLAIPMLGTRITSASTGPTA